MTSVINIGIYEEYFNLQSKYVEQYEKYTILLMQVGAFYEVYGLINEMTIINNFSTVCSLNIADKKSTYNGTNVLMAGFKCSFLDKYIKLLIESKYTVVVYIQEDSEHTTKKKHTFYGVYSAGTYYNDEFMVSTVKGVGVIMCIWFHIYNKICGNGIMRNKTDYIIIGISVIDINTGKSVLYEYETPYLLNVSTTFDELEKYISIYSPREVIIIYNTPLLRKDIEDTICPFIGLYGGNIYNNGTLIRYININDNKYVKRCEEQVYINEILTIFFSKDISKIINDFNEKIIATQSFCYLLNFIQEHNPRLVRKLEIPNILYNTNEIFIDNPDIKNVKGVHNVYLANHTLKQLNIINNSETDNSNSIDSNNLSSVLNFLDKTITTMGSRRLKSILLNPTYNIEWLNKEYNKIEKCLTNYNEIVISIRKTINGICDIDKIIRKIVLRKIDYNKITTLYNGLEIIKKVLDIWKITGEKIDVSLKNVNKLIIFFDTKFDKNIDIKNDILNNNIYIKVGINNELDNYKIEHKRKIKILNELIQELNRIYNTSIGTKKVVDNAVKIHTTEKSGISLIITKTRGKYLRGVLDKLIEGGFNIDNVFISNKDIKMISSSGNEDCIESSYINDLCKDIDNLNKLVIEQNELVFNNILNEFEDNHLQELEEIAEFIGNVDLCCTKAYIAQEYNYNKPIIHIPLTDNDKSFVELKDLRHVLIEHLVKNELYVPNDVFLGSETNKDGLLIFGTNMIGKTSLIRAVGIAVFIAQSGFYVPCSSMRYYPYRSIMTRIVCNDNLFKGISTFAMEMIELRIILRDADKRTLVLGDELGASTEHKSAFSIFMATLMEISRIESTFLFTTHFYEILNMTELSELMRLRLCHLEVSYDGNKLCYNRKLMNGPGLANYGLECCKSMYFNNEFMEIAYKLRNKYYPELAGILNWEKSSYNASKLKGVCEKCGDNMGTEIHHIEEQSKADKRGFLIKGNKCGIHKNVVGNLMSLCEKCHLLEHK